MYLDAKRAFDRVIREILIRRMYLDGVKDCSLLYFDQRLSNRKTIIEWNKELLMPIFDEQGRLVVLSTSKFFASAWFEKPPFCDVLRLYLKLFHEDITGSQVDV